MDWMEFEVRIALKEDAAWILPLLALYRAKIEQSWENGDGLGFNLELIVRVHPRHSKSVTRTLARFIRARTPVREVAVA